MRRTRAIAYILVLSVLCLAGTAALASEEGESAGIQAEKQGDLFPARHEDSLAGKSARLFGAVALICLLSYGCVAWNKRKGVAPEGGIRVVAVKPLGQREKIAVLEILGEKVVLGVTTQSISLLMRFGESIAQPDRGKDGVG